MKYERRMLNDCGSIGRNAESSLNARVLLPWVAAWYIHVMSLARAPTALLSETNDPASRAKRAEGTGIGLSGVSECGKKQESE